MFDISLLNSIFSDDIRVVRVRLSAEVSLGLELVLMSSLENIIKAGNVCTHTYSLLCNHNVTNHCPALTSLPGTIFLPDDIEYMSRVWSSCCVTLRTSIIKDSTDNPLLVLLLLLKLCCYNLTVSSMLIT